MKEKLFLYSTNTYLAYTLAKTFYSECFYVWCAPVFNPKLLDAFDPHKNIPPSSSPFDIYNSLKRDVENRDHHSDKIKNNKLGLKRGAAHMKSKGVIDEEIFNQIIYMIENAESAQFEPLIYIISYEKVKEKLEKVPAHEAANPLSIEYRIPELSLNEFEIMQF